MPEASVSPSWNAIFEHYHIREHDFDHAPYFISAAQIKVACQHFQRTAEKEVRILCKQDTRESRPTVFRESGLFVLPVKNGHYAILKGEGYVDVPPIESPLEVYRSAFPFELETTRVGNSEMQHLDRAFALSLIRHFTDDETLVLTIRGRKYTPEFSFVAGEFDVKVSGVQTEVDAGYEGLDKVVLVEAKGGSATNSIIRQLYYPFRQWQHHTAKKVSTLFFQRTDNDEYHLWQFSFGDVKDYNSIQLVKSARYTVMLPEAATSDTSDCRRDNMPN